MTRDLGPSLFQCLITKSVCCLHEGLTCCRFSYICSKVSVHRRLLTEDGHRFMSVTCLILLPTFPRGPRWRRSGHTSFRPVGMLLDPLTHTLVVPLQTWLHCANSDCNWKMGKQIVSLRRLKLNFFVDTIYII